MDFSSTDVLKIFDRLTTSHNSIILEINFQIPTPMANFLKGKIIYVVK
jgi:hypothetical protein